jgi:hypothetical protein
LLQMHKFELVRNLMEGERVLGPEHSCTSCWHWKYTLACGDSQSPWRQWGAFLCLCQSIIRLQCSSNEPIQYYIMEVQNRSWIIMCAIFWRFPLGAFMF